jgi:hypothetical protein
MKVKSGISIDHIVSQVSGSIVSDMAGEKVMLSVKNGKYYNLGKTGGDIWELIEGKISILQLVDSLVTNYEVDRSVCIEQVITFLENLLNEGLIEVSG